MGIAILYFTALVVLGTYTYTFREDFSKETLDGMTGLAVALTVLVIIFGILL